MIGDKIVFGIRDRPVQEKLLREYDLTLERALDICRASETSKEQYQAMSSLHQQDIAVHDIRAGEKRGQKQGQSQNSRSQRQCKYCGSTHPPRQCPAYNKKCNKCGCLNHFAAVCKDGGSKVKHSKPVHTLLNVETGDSANENSLFAGQLFVGDIQNTDWRAELRLCDVRSHLSWTPELKLMCCLSVRTDASGQSNN